MRMQQVPQFRLALHALPVVNGRFAGGQHVDRADRICTHCGPGSLVDELHVVHECPLLQPLWQQYAALLIAEMDTMRSFLLGSKIT